MRTIIGDDIFTIRYLRLKGMSDLDVLGFNDKFIEYLLETIDVHSSEVKDMDGHAVKIFAFNKKPKLGDLIIQIVEPVGLMDLSDVWDELSKTYGIRVADSSIIRSVRKTPLFYEESIQKIYVTKEDMRRFANGS